MNNKKLNRIHTLQLAIYHRWRAFLRRQKHHLFSRLYAGTKHRWIPKPSDSIVVPTLYGFDVFINAASDKVIGRSIYYNGTYEPGTLYIISKCLSQGDIYFDIGSNLGLMALYASTCVGPSGKVFAFEPEPDMHERLKYNIELNHIKNIEPHQLALGQTNGTATIYKSETNTGAASLLPSEELTGGMSEIKTERLDTFLHTKKIDSIRMMKLDVEGWELEVLKGGGDVFKAPNAPILCVECSDLRPLQGGTKEDLFNYIKNINHYQIYRLKRGKGRISSLLRVETEEQLTKHDNLFCFLPVHLKSIDVKLFKS